MRDTIMFSSVPESMLCYSDQFTIRELVQNAEALQIDAASAATFSAFRTNYLANYAKARRMDASSRSDLERNKFGIREFSCGPVAIKIWRGFGFRNLTITWRGKAILKLAVAQ